MRAKVLVKTADLSMAEYDVCDIKPRANGDEQVIICYTGSKDRSYGKGPWVGGDMENRLDIVGVSDILSAVHLD